MTTWINPANIMLSERGQVSKAKHCVSCLYIDSEEQTPKAEDQIEMRRAVWARVGEGMCSPSQSDSSVRGTGAKI